MRRLNLWRDGSGFLWARSHGGGLNWGASAHGDTRDPGGYFCFADGSVTLKNSHGEVTVLDQNSLLDAGMIASARRAWEILIGDPLPRPNGGAA